jgi:hypothetical protein
MFVRVHGNDGCREGVLVGNTVEETEKKKKERGMVVLGKERKGKQLRREVIRTLKSNN